MLDIKNEIKKHLRLGHDMAPEAETIANIEAGIDFQGAKLWILILAIFVASLGLNTNSTAVIIGAMLISPLMGPIIGMGLSLGLSDLEMLKRSFRSYAVATVFSVGTATLYFLLTPFDEVQSELLARTSPTIYDVLIALCGGLAGIIALGSKSQRGGNVIPGVAIATALMPPLCTVGFGLATANWLFALGAFYLYLINTVFISLATYIGAAFIMKFKKRQYLDKQVELKYKRIYMAVIVFAVIPSIFLTFMMVKRSIFEQHAHAFCHDLMHWENTRMIAHDVDYKKQNIHVVLMGEEIDSVEINKLHEQLPNYKLEGITLDLVQGTSGLREDDIERLVKANQDNLLASTQMIELDEKRIKELEGELEEYRELNDAAVKLLPEMRVFYPQVSGVSVSQGRSAYMTDSVMRDSVLTFVVLKVDGKMGKNDTEKLGNWLKKRINRDNLYLVTDL